MVSTDEGVLLKPLKPFQDTSLDDVAGCLAYEGKAKRLEEMEAAEAGRRRK